jgi:hypothetical protein
VSAARPYLDVVALQAALDAERVARGMTWVALAREVHVSVPSLRSMTAGRRIEADAVVLMLQWLRRPCDDFVVRQDLGCAPPASGRPQPPVPPLYARFDTIALHLALDRARSERGLTWDDVAGALGVSPGVIARFTKGGRTNADLMVAAADWAGEPVEALLQPSRPVLGPARMDSRARLTGENGGPRPA